MKVNNIKEAWKVADEIFPTDYNKDEQASERAGYSIYRSPINYYDYICELGDRLEVNLANGKTINIWIEKDFTDDEKKELCGYIDTFLYKLEDNFGYLHSEEMSRYGLDRIMKELNEVYDQLNGERI